jgi:transcriptional regulator with XRE-family HTH domain
LKTLEYCVALKRRLKITSDYELAKRLDVSKTTISNYTTGRRAFDVSMSVRVAEMLELDPLKVIADTELERGTNDELWSRIAKKVAVFTFAVIVGSIAAPSPTYAASSIDAGAVPVYYVKSLLRRLRRWFGWYFRLPGFADNDPLTA